MSLQGVDYFDFDFERLIACTNTFTFVFPRIFPSFKRLFLFGVAFGVPISPITSFFLWGLGLIAKWKVLQFPGFCLVVELY